MNKDTGNMAVADNIAKISQRIHSIQDLEEGSEVLAIAMNKGEELVIRVEALSKIRDPDVLKKVVLDKEDRCRGVVLENIHDDNVLLQVALDDDEETIASEAADLINDIEKLKNIASNSKHIYTRRVAVGKLSDQEVLFSLILESDSPILAEAAIERIENEDLLFQILDANVEIEIKCLAIYKCRDQSGLVLFKNRVKNQQLVRSATVRIKQIKKNRVQTKRH